MFRLFPARKIRKIIFLQDHILQEKLCYNFTCKNLARFFISCEKSFIFSARKILTRFGYFLQDGFYWADLDLRGVHAMNKNTYEFNFNA